MNEDARDGNSPTGQALGNLALLVAAPLTIAGGLYASSRLAKGAWNMTKGARGKVAETAENIVNKAKTAKDIKNISKDIVASNPEDSFMKNELKDLANDQRMNEKYIKQNNPEIKQDELKERARTDTKHNIENKQLLSEVDVTGDMDGIFAEQSGFEGMEMPKGHAEYATGNSHNMATSGSGVAGPTEEELTKQHIIKKQNEPVDVLTEARNRQHGITNEGNEGEQTGFFMGDTNDVNPELHKITPNVSEEKRQMARENINARNSSFGNAREDSNGNIITPGKKYSAPIGPEPKESSILQGGPAETNGGNNTYDWRNDANQKPKHTPDNSDKYLEQTSLLPDDDFADIIENTPKRGTQWQGPMPAPKPMHGPSPLPSAENSAFNNARVDGNGNIMSDETKRVKLERQRQNNQVNDSKRNSIFNDAIIGNDGKAHMPANPNPNAYESSIGPEIAPPKGNGNGGGKRRNKKRR